MHLLPRPVLRAEVAGRRRLRLLRGSGPAEINEWSVLDGAYTVTDFAGVDPNTGALAPLSASAHATMASIGPGIRAFICDKIDLGVGFAFPISSQSLLPAM